jgi:SAM-dependent methyltransferase
MTFEKMYKRIEKYIKKSSSFFLALFLLAIIFILINMKNSLQPKHEGFTNQREKFVLKKNFDIYDDFYVDIYDDLFYRKVANKYEVGIIQEFNEQPENKILQIGSKTGHIAKLLSDYHNNSVFGIDESKAMVNLAKEDYPSINFSQKSPTSSMTFQPSTFNTIVCLDMTFYYYKNQRQILDNIYNWLTPGGHFIVQLVNKNMFDPVVPMSKPFVMINPQNFAKKRITQSNVEFNNFNYKSDFEVFPNDFAEFKEVFKDKENKVRQHSQELYMPSIKKIKNMCKEVGFIIHSKYDLVNCHLEYQYLLVFQKPT